MSFYELWNDEHGATAVEYALMLAAIASAVIVITFVLGVRVNASFADMDAKLAAHEP